MSWILVALCVCLMLLDVHPEVPLRAFVCIAHVVKGTMNIVGPYLEMFHSSLWLCDQCFLCLCLRPFHPLTGLELSLIFNGMLDGMEAATNAISGSQAWNAG